MKYKYAVTSDWGYGLSKDIKEAVEICKRQSIGMPETHFYLHKIEDKGQEIFISPDGIFDLDQQKRIKSIPLDKEERNYFNELV